MLRLSLILLLALAACATPKGPWTVVGVADEEFKAGCQVVVAAAKKVTPDRHGWLAMGGEIVVHEPPNWINCAVGVPPEKTSGCADPGRVDILVYPPYLGPHPLQTALAHELCHLGLERGGGYFGGPVIIPSDKEADACAKQVADVAAQGFFQ